MVVAVKNRYEEDEPMEHIIGKLLQDLNRER
jgi:hypothetical protein